MKTTLLIAFAAIFVLVGCGDFDVTDPVSDALSTQNGAYLQGDDAGQVPTGSGVISLNETIRMTGQSSSGSQVPTARILGSVSYNVTLEPIFVNDFYRVELSLQSTVTPNQAGTEPAWGFSGESTDRIQFDQTPNPGSVRGATLTKYYTIGNPHESITLTVVYRITPQSVSIEDMWCTERIR